MIEGFLAAFFGTVLGGIIIYEYSRWRTLMIVKKYDLESLLPKKGELHKVE